MYSTAVTALTMAAIAVPAMAAYVTHHLYIGRRRYSCHILQIRPHPPGPRSCPHRADSFPGCCRSSRSDPRSQRTGCP
ncbi:hypothetical protein BXZ70DRAFT_436836 [Cristinia sonorae]|uniref:Uncharacterized protein n=1 Tax=Cristinia sonorae TaxID=1940300 RepID=A0A8K0UHU7_9AGAR|nr:hypothetical protein BXZ70DRAFT_436836 [Cristinia sonorae]